jgi:hypothetical protein
MLLANFNVIMKKTYVMAIVLVVILLGAGCWYWQSKSGVKINTNEEVAPTVSTNPLDNKPNINPIDQTNPFTKIKTNPFE